MSKSSDTALDQSLATSLPQSDHIENLAQSSLNEAFRKDISSSPDRADQSDHSSEDGDSDASRPGDADKSDEIKRPWEELEDYMIRGKPPEYNAEGLVTLWNAQYETGSKPSDYMVSDFDIIVVHGIRGSRRPPWRNLGAGDSKWLYDQGPYGGRKVMSFGYNISKVICGIYTHQAIRNVAISLLDDLIHTRAGSNKDRPIMFIAHDIGGIIVKCLFYGCPHRATDILDMEDGLSKFIYGHTSLESPALPPLVNSISHLANAVILINSLFMDSKQMFGSHILSLYSDNGGSLIDKTFGEYKGTLGLPLEIRLPSGLEDDRHRIEESVNQLTLLNVDRVLLGDARCLISIASPLLPLRATPGSAHSYSWIVDNEAYKSWHSQQKQDLLYLYGLSSTDEASEYIFFHLDSLRADDDEEFVLYFTFNRYDIRRCKAENMLATFLAQMSGYILEDPEACMMDDIRVYRGWNYMDLFDTFEFYCFNKSMRITCVLTNLDECEPVSRKVFLDSFRDFSRRREGFFKVMATSREPGALLEELSNWPILNLDSAAPVIGNNVAVISSISSLQRYRPEIRVYGALLEDEINVIASLEPEVRELLLSYVSGNECWPLQKSIHEILGPVEGMSLESAVEKILNNVPDKDLASNALSWITYAIRPLTPSELATATMFGLQRSTLEEVSASTQSTSWLMNELRTWLSGIIVLEHNEIMISTHGIRRILATKLSRSRDNMGILGKETHLMIAQTCMAYLAHSEIKEHLRVFYDDSYYNGSYLAISDDRTTLQNYAIRFWMYHLSVSSINNDPAGIVTSVSKSELMPFWSRAYWVFENPFTRNLQPQKSLYPSLAGAGLFEQAENLFNEDENKCEALIEAGLNGAFRTFRQLLPRQEYSDETLAQIIIIAGASGKESLLLELIEFITKIYDNFPWKSQKTIVARASFLGLNKALIKLLEAGCLVDAEVPGDLTPRTPLRLATRVNNVDGARTLLEQGADPNHINRSKSTCLHVASHWRHPEMIQLLVQYGADIDAVDEDLESPLLVACETGYSKTVESLVKLNANLNLKSVENQNEPGWSALASAARLNHAQCVRILLEANADIEISTPHWGTPLAVAVALGSLDICKLLVEKGANPNHELIAPPILLFAMHSRDHKFRLEITKVLVERGVRINACDSEGRTALHYACWSDELQKYSIVEYLLEKGADVNYQDNDGDNPLHIAVTKGDITLLQILLNQDNINMEAWNTGKWTPLNLAAKSEKLARMLLDNDANPNARPASDKYALLSAVNGNHTDTVRLLLQYGAQIDLSDELRDDTRWEPMELAVFKGQEDIVRILAEAGADFNRRFLDGSTLIHRGLNSTGLGALLEFRPKLDVKNNAGNAPLHEVVEKTPLENVQLLIRAGSDVNLTNKIGMTPITRALIIGREDIARYYLSRKADLNIISPVFGGPLHAACSAGRVDWTKELIETGADVNLVATEFVGAPLSSIFIHHGFHDSPRKTKSQLMNILFNAGADPGIMGGWPGSVASAVALGGEIDHLNMLASKGASLISSDSTGRQPLHFAAMCGDSEMVSFLLNAGAKATEEDEAGRNAMSWAAQGGNISILHDFLQLTSNGLFNKPDRNGWTPLCWAVRGTGNTIWLPRKGDHRKTKSEQYEMIKMLLDRGANRTTKLKINGREHTPATIARYHSCSDDILELLAPSKKGDQQTTRDDVLHENDNDSILENHKRLRESHCRCAFCFFYTDGLEYTCTTCLAFVFCYKCYTLRDRIHLSGHEFKEVGPEFIEDDAASPTRSSSPVPSETSYSSDSTSDDGDGDEARASQTKRE
ncbi:ankyrin repeat-containing domain protein [Annulohypoxylon nitens]|nr:ankyrin repeat-containing domain protein [Annulohypoxylon nitens]